MIDGLVATNVSSDALPTPGDERTITAIYPNPADLSGTGGSGFVTIEYGSRGVGADDPQIEIFDVLARRIPVTSQFATGLYFVRLRFGDGAVSEAHQLVVTERGTVRFDLRERSGD